MHFSNHLHLLLLSLILPLLITSTQPPPSSSNPNPNPNPYQYNPTVLEDLYKATIRHATVTNTPRASFLELIGVMTQSRPYKPSHDRSDGENNANSSGGGGDESYLDHLDMELKYLPQLMLSLGEVFSLLQILSPPPPKRNGKSLITISKDEKSRFFKFIKEDFYGDEPLWLVRSISNGMVNEFYGGLKGVDWSCVSGFDIDGPDDLNDLHKMDHDDNIDGVGPRMLQRNEVVLKCCPNYKNLSPPTLATKFLSDLYDAHTKLSIFFDSYGLPSLSMYHLLETRRLCGGFTGTEIRGALYTPVVDVGFEAMRVGREHLGFNVGALFYSSSSSNNSNNDDDGDGIQEFFKITEPMLSSDMEWTSTPVTMMIGYQGLNDHLALKKIADGFTFKFGKVGGILGGVKVHDSVIERRVDSAVGVTDAGVTADRINVGIITNYFHSHTVGKLFLPTILTLSPSLLNVTCISLSHKHDPTDTIYQSYRNTCATFTTIQLTPTNRLSVTNVIRALMLDVVIYPELGMDALTYYMSYTRLAPVQFVWWGHPVSQGIGAIDFFVTSGLFEGGFGYSGEIEIGDGGGKEANGDGWGLVNEQRVLMNGLTTSFSKPKLVAAPTTEADTETETETAEYYEQIFGPNFTTKNVYTIPQTLMKFTPLFDTVLISILKLDADAVIYITYNPDMKGWKDVLEYRIIKGFMDSVNADTTTNSKDPNTKIYDEISSRLTFLPTLPPPLYNHLLKNTMVILDPLTFGGGITTLEILAVNTPVVTMGRYSEGEGGQSVVALAVGFYGVMGISEGKFYKHDGDGEGESGNDSGISLVVKNRAEYIRSCLHLAENRGDNGYRRSAVTAIRENVDKLFVNDSSVTDTDTDSGGGDGKEWVDLIVRVVRGGRVRLDDVVST